MHAWPGVWEIKEANHHLQTHALCPWCRERKAKSTLILLALVTHILNWHWNSTCDAYLCLSLVPMQLQVACMPCL